jgi:hypothetical protein
MQCESRTTAWRKRKREKKGEEARPYKKTCQFRKCSECGERQEFLPDTGNIMGKSSVLRRQTALMKNGSKKENNSPGGIRKNRQHQAIQNELKLYRLPALYEGSTPSQGR